jgi:hypothetical protein
LTGETGNSVTELNYSGALFGNYNPTNANFNGPFAIAIDSGGNAWIANSAGAYVTELTSSGELAGSFDIGFLGLQTGVAIDASGNVWLAIAGALFPTPAPRFVVEIIGAAGPVLTPVEACLKRTPPHAVCKP